MTMPAGKNHQVLREEAAQREAAAQHENYDSDDDDDDYLASLNRPSSASSTEQQQQTQQQQQQQTQHQQYQQNQQQLGSSNSMLSPRHPTDTNTNTSSPYPNNTWSTPDMTVTGRNPSTPGGASINSNNNAAASARKEWRQHGSGATQVLEEKRRSSAAGGGPGQWTVRVVQAQKRVDFAGSNYTAYVVQVQQQSQQNQQNQNQNQQPNETLLEHRYSDFAKLHSIVAQHQPHCLHLQFDSSVAFPSKHWAGRVGNWTPSLTWAPEKHSDLIHYRIKQLDIWLVHLTAVYNQGELPDPVAAALYDFLTAPDRPPCEQVNDMKALQDQWKWNNPFSFTLGSSVRQATYTVDYMCHNVLTAKEQSIPLDLLHAARGLCFMTVFKAGLVVSGRVGTGLVIARLNDDSWSAPCALGTVGMGWGALIGGDVTHYLVVLTTDQAVQDFVASSSVQLGAELGVAVGPVGRGANSHISAGDWTLHPAYAYAHSQGLFVGMSLEGSVVTVRNDVNAKFYGRACEPVDLLQQSGPKAAEPLYQALDKAMRIEIPDGSFRPSYLWSPQVASLATPRVAGGGHSSNSGTQSSSSYSDSHSRPASAITIDTMQSGPGALFDQATPSTVVQGSIDNNNNYNYNYRNA
jgi:lipid-binding SYLF domain-containing protein